MRQKFFWRFIICLVPCLWAAWVTGAAIDKYARGESGGFKLGVDLVGGTILVYEIDARKSLEDAKSGKTTDAATLAEALKRRIDPNDLYNIVIRPAGGEGRVEIVLPTGGAHRTQIAEENWDKNVLKYFSEKYKLKNLEVGRGRINDLAETIHLRLSEAVWEKNVFKGDAWEELLKKAESREDWIILQKKENKEKLAELPKGDLDALVEFIRRTVGGTTTENLIQLWVKDQAWKDLLERARQKWPELDAHAKEMERIPRDSYEQLVTFIQMKGNVVNQAAVTALQPLLGDDFVKVKSKDFIDRKEITDFIEKYYGPSLESITREIQARYDLGGQSRDLTSEEVQRIKDLVARVGSLEFRILANSTDDKDAIEDAKRVINQDTPPEVLKELGDEGKLPPAPETTDGKPKFYTLKLPRGQKSRVSYSWVELGKQERRQLGLDNAAQNDPQPNRHKIWDQMAGANRGRAIQLDDPFSARGRKVLQGALFYSRPCKDRNLPEVERNEKKIEYFVLARNPETINPDDLVDTRQTSKIDGRYLRNAYADRTGISPAVHFTFNTTGGELFGTLTRKNVPSGEGSEETQIKRHLAIILDGQVMSAPTINSEIRSQGQITGNFTIREVNELVNILRGGALPASLKPQPVSESTMGPSLGQDTISRGLLAIVVALGAVVAFMLLYYRFAGLVASIALLANLLITIGFMVAVQATFTLPGLAGLVLMLGMAVDANVLIYERIREERERGANLAMAIRNGYDRAFPTIIDTHLTSIFTAVVLYVVGNDQLKGFGVSLTAGLVISLFTSLYMTHLMFDFWLERKWLTKLSMLRFFTRPDIDFMGIRNIMFAATIILSVLGIGLFVLRLPNDLNIDFVGGTAYSGELVQPVDIEQLRAFVDADQQDKMLHVTKVTEDKDSDGTRFEVVYLNPDGGTEARTIALANKPDGATPEERQEKITKRVSVLKDPSVEQIFLSTYKPNDPNYDPNTTPYFKIRTSEKETDIVQTTLDRLVRAKGKGDHYVSLMRRVAMWAAPLGEKGTRLYFYDKEPPKNFDPNTEYSKKESERAPMAYASPSFIKTLFTHELRDVFDKKEGEELPVAFSIEGEGKSKDGRYQSMFLKFYNDLKPEQVEKVETALAETRREFAQRPQPDSLENFDSQLSSETRVRAMWAIIASWGAILLYLWFRFGSWTFGLAAVLCLVHDLAFSIGIVAACHYLYAIPGVGSILMLEDFKIDLTSVAALLTMIGYSVSDTIVVFDRIREVRGKNPDLTATMINDSVNQTLSRTLLTSVTTFLVVFVLYIMGGPGVHLFSFIIMIGVIIGTYSSIYIASPLLLILGEGARAKAKVRERQPQTQVEGSPA